MDLGERHTVIALEAALVRALGLFSLRLPHSRQGISSDWSGIRWCLRGGALTDTRPSKIAWQSYGGGLGPGDRS